MTMRRQQQSSQPATINRGHRSRQQIKSDHNAGNSRARCSRRKRKDPDDRRTCQQRCVTKDIPSVRAAAGTAVPGATHSTKSCSLFGRLPTATCPRRIASCNTQAMPLSTQTGRCAGEGRYSVPGGRSGQRKGSSLHKHNTAAGEAKQLHRAIGSAHTEQVGHASMPGLSANLPSAQLPANHHSN